MAIITLPARPEAVADGIAFVLECASTVGVSPARAAEIELALEEALVNICQYAYGDDDTGTVEIRCQRDNTVHFLIEVIDTGQPFNILALPPPDLTADIEQRPVGGLGVLFIRTLMDHVTYRRDGNQNILQLTVQLVC
jgi:anti-sigma regulatory factor (Ser/Thr protein kinase)